MGQYYKPLNLNTFEWLYSHDFDNGLKLMEHSYLNNSFVGVIMKLLTKGNKWYKTRIIWCGDYSEKVFKEFTLYDMCYDEDEDGIKVFNKILPKSCLQKNRERKCFLVNHDKKVYLDFSKLKPFEKDWIINPLPLLTAFGNGGGGGDYHGSFMSCVGSWAGDIISVEFDKKELQNYEEDEMEFEEGEEEGDNEENDINTTEKIKEWLKTDEVKKRLVLAGLK